MISLNPVLLGYQKKDLVGGGRMALRTERRDCPSCEEGMVTIELEDFSGKVGNERLVQLFCSRGCDPTEVEGLLRDREQLPLNLFSDSGPIA